MRLTDPATTVKVTADVTAALASPTGVAMPPPPQQQQPAGTEGSSGAAWARPSLRASGAAGAGAWRGRFSGVPPDLPSHLLGCVVFLNACCGANRKTAAMFCKRLRTN